MAIYTGDDKRLKYLFKPIYSTTAQQIGTWIDDSPMYGMVIVATISSASSVDEVIYDLTSLGFSFIEIISATLDTGSGFWPIMHELNVDGTDLVYNGSHGAGTAYITIHYC